MGFFNRDYRCYDGDSIDTAATMESIYSSVYDDDPWRSSSFDTDTSSSSWSNGNDDTWSTDLRTDEW